MLSTNSPVLEAVGSDASGLYVDVSTTWAFPSVFFGFYHFTKFHCSTPSNF